MNMNDYIKTIKDYAIKSGITDSKELHEVAILSIYKILQTPALKGYLRKHKLAYNAHESNTLALVEDSLGGGSYSINDDNTINTSSSYINSQNEMFVKNDELKLYEQEIYNILSDSDTFVGFSKSFREFSQSSELSKFERQTKIDKILIQACKLQKRVADGDVGHIEIKVEPFAYICSNYDDKSFAEFLTKTIDEKIDFLKDDETFFQTLSTIDGLLFTSIDKFKEALKNNQLDEDSILLKLLISNDPIECIEAVFEGEWFETYKERTLTSLKRCLAIPTIDSLYSEYPIIDTILDSICEKYPYFNIPQNDMLQIKVVIENDTTTNEEKEKNRNTYLEDANQFTFDEIFNDDDEIDENNYSRVYGVTPFGVLIEIGGEQTYSDKGFSIITVNKMPMNSNLSEENERLCIEKFMNHCEQNKIICCYEGDMISEHVVNVFKEFEGKVIIIDRDDRDQDKLMAYQLMISNMNLSYNQMLQLEKEIPLLGNHLDEKEIIEILNSKLKNNHKLTP